MFCIVPFTRLRCLIAASGLIGKTTPAGLTLETDVDVANYLLEDGGVAVVPGVAFGVSPYFRMCWCEQAELIVECMARIERAVAALADGA